MARKPIRSVMTAFPGEKLPVRITMNQPGVFFKRHLRKICKASGETLDCARQELYMLEGMKRILCRWLGVRPYGEAMEIMDRTFAGVAAGGDPVLLLLEHTPVITLGRHADAAHIRADARMLAARGIDVVETGRGGDVTFHGPGQLVGYPVMPVGRMVRRHVERIFGALEDMLMESGIACAFDVENPGLWVGSDKIAAVGIEIRDGISLHGFCLNVRREHEGFSYIVPCGITDKGVVYWSDLQDAPTVLQAAQAFAVRFAERCNAEPVFSQEWPG